MKDEASRHGLCNNVLIPRPTADNPTPAGMCKVSTGRHRPSACLVTTFTASESRAL